MFPVRPNGLVVRYILVDGGTLNTPYLSEYPLNGDHESESESESGSGSGMVERGNAGYSMVVSRFQVTYGVPNCGYGIGLLVGSYDNNTEPTIKVDQVRNTFFCIVLSLYHCLYNRYKQHLDQ